MIPLHHREVSGEYTLGCFEVVAVNHRCIRVLLSQRYPVKQAMCLTRL